MKSKVLNIAHRGFSFKYPENTFEAFEQAQNVGADGFECDLRMTKDKKIVVFHDDSLKRLCGVKGNIETLEWNEVKNLKVLSKNPIPLLDELLESFPNLIKNFEIKKSKLASELISLLFKKIIQKKPTAQVVISSFEESLIEQSLEENPSPDVIGVSPIFESFSDSIFKKFQNENRIFSWNLKHTAANEKGIRDLANLDLKKFWLWTPNNPQEWTKCLESNLQIGALISDRPNELKDYLKPPAP